jgi:hypothetical protein
MTGGTVLHFCPLQYRCQGMAAFVIELGSLTRGAFEF